MKNTFKDGQKVNHPKYGEGVIKFHTIHETYWITFSEVCRGWSAIGDDFYSQLDPIEDLPEVGQYAYFWNEGWNYCAYAKYHGKKDGKYQTLNIMGISVDYSYISKTPPFV